MRWLYWLALLAVVAFPAVGSNVVMMGYGASGAPVTATDWTGSFLAVWHLDEASGNAINNTGTKIATPSQCDLTDTNTVTSYNADNPEGAAARSFDKASDEYFLRGWVNAADCDELRIAAPLSWGGWARLLNSNVQSTWSFYAGSNATAYSAYVGTTSNDEMRCQLDTATEQAITYWNSTFPTNDWTHFTCTWANDADDNLMLYQDAVADGNPDNTIAAFPQPPAVDNPGVALSRNSAANDWDGQLDEMFVIDKELTLAQVCRICSCGIDGTDCTCNGASYLTSGRNTSCGTCTLPACNAVGP